MCRLALTLAMLLNSANHPADAVAVDVHVAAACRAAVVEANVDEDREEM